MKTGAESNRSGGAEWPTAAHDFARTGCLPGGEGIRTEPSIQWTYRTDGTVHSPAIADGTIYVGSHDSTLYALDMTGDCQWRYDTDGWVNGTPTVVGKRVFVGSEDSELHAVNAASGTQLWTRELDGAAIRSPAVAEGTVIIGTHAGRLHAVDAETGAKRWVAAIDGGDTSPALGDGAVLVGDLESVRSFDGATGTERWEAELGRTVTGTAVRDGTVYACTLQAGLFALRTETGDKRWESGFDGDNVSGVSVGESMVFVATNWVLSAFDRATGELRWEFDAPERRRLSAPAIVGDVVYTGSGAGAVLALDTATGSLLWRAETQEYGHTSPAAIGKRVLVGTDHRIYAIGPDDD